jgi:hypothetical protein
MLHDILQSISAAFRAGSFTPQEQWPELESDAACDKHRELADDAFIKRCQDRIVAKGGTVRIMTPQDHAARLKGRRTK